jgi:hypothetical protein
VVEHRRNLLSPSLHHHRLCLCAGGLIALCLCFGPDGILNPDRALVWAADPHGTASDLDVVCGRDAEPRRELG